MSLSKRDTKRVAKDSARVLEHLRQHGPQAARDMISSLNLTGAQIGAHMRRLIEAGKAHINSERKMKYGYVPVYGYGGSPDYDTTRHPLDVITAQWAKPKRSMREAA